MFVESVNGLVDVSGIKFTLNDEECAEPARIIKGGSYELNVTDVTKGLPSRLKMPKMKMLLKLVDIDAENELAAV